jgi:hypothetical protein
MVHILNIVRQFPPLGTLKVLEPKLNGEPEPNLNSGSSSKTPNFTDLELEGAV